MTTHTFKVGQAYSTRFACDYDSILTRTVVKRTAKTVWLADSRGEVSKRGVFISYGVEMCRPTGNYSMAPILSADR